MNEKDFFITSIPLVDLQGSKAIPTVLFYGENGRAIIGSDAKAATEALGRDALNEDFKIDLGMEEPTSTSKKKFVTASGHTKSAGDLTGEFLYQLLRQVRDWLEQQGLGGTAGIVIAEPLRLSDDDIKETWLSNYRSNIRRILVGQQFDANEIDFLPEPFAVFQYYKYGMRHPLLSSQVKQNALVIDFGGGSFDVCIIQTDKQGEITNKRKNTKPLAASSAAIGGYFVNRCIAEELFFKYCQGDKERKTETRKGIEVYNNWRNGQVDLAVARLRLQTFAKNFHRAIYAVEDPKITLCNSISNWELGSKIDDSIQFRWPKDPFDEDTTYFTAELSANEFREIFVKRVWRERLEPEIKKAVVRGKEELLGEPITIVLLSGGSCNIRWLTTLINENFATYLKDADILQLDDDFQEVVAKGVAAECSRRFYRDNHEGDFTSVTYNRLHLMLNPDKKGFQMKIFNPVDGNPIPETKKQCVLLPAASSLRNQFDKPLRWRVKLDSPPRNFLDYYFLRSGFSPHKTVEINGEQEHYPSDELLNFDNSVRTPPDCHFDSTIDLELKIEKETKTARVKFIYSRETRERKGLSVDGKPFYIEMTDTQDSPTAKAYLGLDFGTSNTSVSYVSQASIKVYEKRKAEKHWQDLSQLHRFLPFPLAAPLAKYLGESFNQTNQVKYGREFVEAALSLASYISYLEMLTLERSKERHLFKSFDQRSVGPLWKFLQDTQRAMGKEAKISAPFGELIDEQFFKTIDDAVTFFGQNKHEKASDSDFNPRVVNILGNVCQKMFSTYRFGYFENIQLPRFRRDGASKGLFRIAVGDNSNFTESVEYEGSVAFPSRIPYLVDFEERIALPLQPLMFWYQCESHPDFEHYYIYDKNPLRNQVSDSFSFKAAAFPCSLIVSTSHPELGPIAEDLKEYCSRDTQVSLERF